MPAIVSPRRIRLIVIAVGLTAPLQTGFALGRQNTTALPPVSYVCPMVGDEDVLEDKPGQCPKCKMTLVPVRIDSAWTCPNHPAVITTKGGKCPIDRRDLVEVAVALYWTCPGAPNERLMEPGRCADGVRRQEKRELRAHGDHNPRHGGQFFMAADKWHHLEGAYPSKGLFRLYLYDNFTKPFDVKSVSGRAVTKEENGRDIVSFELRPSKDGKTLDAQVKNASLPLTVAAKLKFNKDLAEQRFDFTFTEFSKDPAAAPTSRSVTPVTTAASGKQATPSPVRATPASGPQASSATSVPVAAAPRAVAPASTKPVLTDCVATMSRTDAEQLADALPHSSGELLKLIVMCDGTAQKLISEGQLGSVFLPAMLGKDIALALEGHVNELPEQRKREAANAIRRLVLAAWQLDSYGDLGNREKLSEAYQLFSAAVADITSAYGAQQQR